jgi:hypothetical protein
MVTKERKGEKERTQCDRLSQEERGRKRKGMKTRNQRRKGEGQ